MNKTTSINLGGRNFFIEEEAYKKLEAYLNTIKARFAEYPGSGEIVADMEARIGEKFGEKYDGNSQAVITIVDVDNLISELGSVEDIAGEEGQKEQKKTSYDNSAPKRLMRNGDDKIIAGVCSGLAAYFDIDPIIFRAIFVILIFAWGTIIPIYFVLWLIMPEAKTTTEKMQMRGQAFNLGNISETIKERAEEFKSHVSSVKTKEEWKKWKQDIKEQAHKVKDEAKQWGKKMEADIREKKGEWETPKTESPAEPVVEPVVEPAPEEKAKTQTMNEEMPSTPTRNRGGFGNFLRQIFQGIGKIILFFIKLLRKIIGMVLVIAFSFALAGVTVSFATAIFNVNSPYIGLPLATIPHTAIFYLLLVVAYVIVFIPLLLLLLCAVSILSGGRSGMNVPAFSSLFAVWVLALIVGGAVGMRYVPGYINEIKSSPQLQTVSKSYNVNGFNSVDISNSINAKLVQGNTFSVEASGWQMDMDKLNVSVNNGTLTVNRDGTGFCVFCISGHDTVVITAPSFAAITASNSADVTGNQLTGTTTSLNLSNSASANINYTVNTLNINLENSSTANLNGSADTMDAKLSNSSQLLAKDLAVQNATVSTENSSQANVNVSNTLTYSTSNSSQIYYSGNPTVTPSRNGDSDNPPVKEAGNQ